MRFKNKIYYKKNLYSRPLISIIVATYNSEKYLEQCLKVFLNKVIKITKSL